MASLEEQINKATAETNTIENWGIMIEVCERADKSDASAREAVQILTKRINHRNVNVVLFTLTLANALVQNCRIGVHREISSRAFVDALVKQAANKQVHETVRMRILDLIQQWSAAFKEDPTLGFMVDTYNQLKSQGYPFPNPNKKPETVRAQSAIDKDKEDEELQLALALSLSAQETEKKKVNLILNMPAVVLITDQKAKSKPSQPSNKALCKVRALYDFPGLEEGELRMSRGDIVDVYDDTTFKDWWKGELRGKVGIFPSNYVEKVADADTGGAQRGVGGIAGASNNVSDGTKVDEFMQLLSRIDPRRDNLSENDRVQVTMLLCNQVLTKEQELYHAILLMRPKLIKDVETKYATQEELRILNERFANACTTYHKLMDASLTAQRNAYQHQQYAPPPQSYAPAPFTTPYQQAPAQQQPYTPPQQYQQNPYQTQQPAAYYPGQGQ
ncbi:ESCRT-0 subunit protein hse1 [Irineochytrium annulatum]|nr:ESCRT-0 subunit protein hse1 [Irineochytrium annulatum]